MIFYIPLKKLIKIELFINSLKCPKAKPSTHCLTELFQIYQTNHWTIRWWNDQKIVPSYYIKDCRIYYVKHGQENPCHACQIQLRILSYFKGPYKRSLTVTFFVKPLESNL